MVGINDEEILDFHITQSEDERTPLAKKVNKLWWAAMDAANTSKGKETPSLQQKIKKYRPSF